MAKVPQLDPIENAVNAATTKTSAGSAKVGKASLITCARNGPVPRARVASPSASASKRMIATGNSAPAPRSDICIRLSMRSPARRASTQARVRPAHTAQSTEVEPEPAVMSPSPVSHSPIGTPRTSSTIGHTMKPARAGSPSSSALAITAGSTIGVAPLRRTSPRRARSSAARIGPGSRSNWMLAAASSTAAMAYRFMGMAARKMPTGSETPVPPSSPRLNAPQAFRGIRMQIGADVASIRYARRSRESRKRSNSGRETAPATSSVRFDSMKTTMPTHQASHCARRGPSTQRRPVSHATKPRTPPVCSITAMSAPITSAKPMTLASPASASTATMPSRPSASAVNGFPEPIRP